MAQGKPGIIASLQGRTREGWDDESRGNATWFTLFSSEMTPSAAMSAGVMELRPEDGRLLPHRHHHAEIYHVMEGTGTLTIEGVETQVTAGMSAFIPGDSEHSLRNSGTGVLKIFYVFPTDSFNEVVYRFPPYND